MKRVIVDMSSVIWTCLKGGKDTEHGREVINQETGKKAWVNSGLYGFEKSMNHILGMMEDLKVRPWQLIFVMEGANSKAVRQYIHKTYKDKRDKLDQEYDSFNWAKEKLIETFRGLGSNIVWQDGGVEADDVIGYLALNLEGERWIDSGDKDLAQLVGGDIHHYRRGEKDVNPLGDFSHRFIPVYFALVGDSADKIPGAKRFGHEKWLILQALFGDDGLAVMETLIKNRRLKELQEDVAEMPALQLVIDDAEMVYTSYELARLHIEKVNTLRRPLRWKAGMVRDRSHCEDDRLRPLYATKRLVTAENYDEAYEWAKKHIAASPFVALDIESSTPEESDEWLGLQSKEDKVVDVLGSVLTSLQMTFGNNLQHTLYLPVDNVEQPGVSNLTVEQVAAFVDLVPRDKVTHVHNAGFELPVCYMAWGEKWASDPLYHGFLRNVRDTAIASSYVDENLSKGLKEQSKTRLDYTQTTYDEVTTKEYVYDAWNKLGKVRAEWWTNDQGEVVTPEEFYDEAEGTTKLLTEGLTRYVRVQHKMNQLTAEECFDYGCDDPACTIALANFFRIVMEIEKTLYAYEEVETWPAYLTALSYVHGKPFSLEEMNQMEREDEELFDAAAPILREYLMSIGFEGTRLQPITELSPAEVKRAYLTVTGEELKTQVRKLDKLGVLISERGHEMLGHLVATGDIANINELMEQHFTGDPKLDLGSPKQMKELLYDYMQIPIRCINDVTPLERVKNPDLDNAVKKFKKKRAGASDVVITEADLKLLRGKARTDDTAIDMALAFDTSVLSDDARAALRAIGKMKKVMTRQSLFYKNWRYARHWKDNLVHSSVNQCAAVTRRYSMSNPNDQQLPKKGDGVRFRGCYKPHKKNAVVASIDYVGQELRLAAEVSQDKNMLACYVGDNLKDIHSITAAGAMKLKWGMKEVSALFETYGADLPRHEEGTYQLFLRLRDLGKEDTVGKKSDDLRKDSKNVNFGAQNGARAAKLAETLIMTFEDAQLFLDARSAMFPDVDKAAEKAAQEAKATGYVTTLMGARRHLSEAMLSDERGAADRAARQAWNFKIQGSAGEMTKMGMGRMWTSGIFFRYDARFYMPVHDELVTSVVEDQALDFLREKHACMAQPYATMKVPVLGSISIGPDFAHQHECGDEYNPERIRAALNKIFHKEEAHV